VHNLQLFQGKQTLAGVYVQHHQAITFWQRYSRHTKAYPDARGISTGRRQTRATVDPDETQKTVKDAKSWIAENYSRARCKLGVPGKKNTALISLPLVKIQIVSRHYFFEIIWISIPMLMLNLM
jgi:hypothetical protein